MYEYSKSVEVLNARQFIDGNQVKWSSIYIPENSLTSCTHPAVVPISETEIIVFGGETTVDTYLNEGSIYNTVSRKATKFQTDLKLCCFGN